MSLGGWLRDVTELLLPAGCVACAAWLGGRARDGLVCGRCRASLRPAPWPRCSRCHHPTGTGRRPAHGCLECREWSPALTAARYAYVLEAPAEDLVHALKYEGWRELAALMGARMARLEVPVEPGASRPLVVPVPTTARRIRERGYNQAELLAQRVASLRGLAVANALRRRRAGASQTGLDPGARRANVRTAFEAAPGAADLTGAHVLLVDDVLTTGATAGAAAEVLAAAGAHAVTVLAFARALPRFRRASGDAARAA